MAESQEHAELAAKVAEAHEQMTGEPATPDEYGIIQAVTRDFLHEVNK